MVDHLVRAVLLAAALLGFAAVPAEARAPAGDGWRSVLRLCRSESRWARHHDGWGPAPREWRGRH